MRTLRLASPLVALLFAAGCGRTGTICETATDCDRGQTCTAAGCVDLPDSGLGGGVGGGSGGGMGGGTGGGLGGGTGGGTGGGGGSSCPGGQTLCPSGCKNLSLDLDNCGSCGSPCPQGANGTATCSGGTCGLRCAPGFANCDLDPRNGCEANFNDPTSCGACRNACPSGPNSTATCSMGVCRLTCAPGFANCDFTAANGCEADLSLAASCGACGNICRAAANQFPTCVMGICGAQCRPGFADCDLSTATGCEANLSSPATCGSCSNACPSGGPNTMATCTGTMCGTQCRPGFGDCDGLAGNGCEADLNSDASCGGCGQVCPVGLPCSNGMCGASCPAPAVGVLPPNTTVSGTLLAGAGRFPAPTCSTNSTRYEDLWTFSLATASNVVFETGGTLDTVLVVRSSCTATTDLGCNDDTPGIGTRSRVSLMLQPGAYSVLVKQWGGTGMGGAYTLSATVSTASNATCGFATPLPAGVPVTNQDSANGGAPSSTCLPSGGGGQLFYRFSVPPSQRATVTVTPTSMANLNLRLLSSCTATFCLSSSQGTAPQELTFENRSAGTQSIIISVSATTSGLNGTFDVVANLGPLSASNVTCNAAKSLPVNGPALFNEAINTGGVPITACMPGQAGRVRYYSVGVPGRGAVTVSATPTFDLGLRVFTSCTATSTCAAFSDAVTGVGSESVRITNPDTFARTYIVAASSTAIAVAGTYSISAVSSTPPANAFCSTPTALTPGIIVSGQQLENGGLPLTNVCSPSQAGYVRYYSVAVPAGSTLQALVTSAWPGLDVGVRLLTSCAASTCAVSSDSSTSDPNVEVALVSNTSAAAQTWVIAASSANTNPPPGATFSVLASVALTAPNAVCSGATPIAVGQTLPAESLAGGGAPNTACLSTVTGLTRYYRVTASPGQRVAITAASANFDATLRIFDACGAASCVASANDSSSGPETVTLQNDLATPRTWLISVSAPATTTGGTFSLSVVKTAYAITRGLMASCSDLSAVPDLLGPATMPLLTDDVGTAALALPFAFPFFATPVTHYSACMNGYVQLLPSAMAPPGCDYLNTQLPEAAAPNGLVAPLWDDLFPVPGVTRIRSTPTGLTPNRVFTVEWFEAAFLAGGAGPERLRLQAKLFETTGVIELHYCSLELNGGSMDKLTGSTSTIGLEDLTGSDALQHSFDRPNSISSGGALRFVPQ